MAVGKNVLQGTSVSKNGLPPMPASPSLILRGEFNGKRAEFSIVRILSVNI